IDEIKTINKLVKALKQMKVNPLAFIEEVINFQESGYDPERDVYIYRMHIANELKNDYKILHGGIISTFIDTAMAKTILRVEGTNARIVTLDLNVRFVSPAQDGWLTAETEIIKKGKKTFLMETKVLDERKKLIAKASSTFFRLK
ncbi:MAG: PaaI family thioesterase, partial [Thermoactinomyces sp.]